MHPPSSRPLLRQPAPSIHKRPPCLLHPPAPTSTTRPPTSPPMARLPCPNPPRSCSAIARSIYPQAPTPSPKTRPSTSPPKARLLFPRRALPCPCNGFAPSPSPPPRLQRHGKPRPRSASPCPARLLRALRAPGPAGAGKRGSRHPGQPPGGPRTPSGSPPAPSPGWPPPTPFPKRAGFPPCLDCLPSSPLAWLASPSCAQRFDANPGRAGFPPTLLLLPLISQPACGPAHSLTLP